MSIGMYGGSFFRGALDEVYVIPAALDATAIRTLMNSDSPAFLFPSNSSK